MERLLPSSSCALPFDCCTTRVLSEWKFLISSVFTAIRELSFSQDKGNKAISIFYAHSSISGLSLVTSRQLHTKSASTAISTPSRSPAHLHDNYTHRHHKHPSLQSVHHLLTLTHQNDGCCVTQWQCKVSHKLISQPNLELMSQAWVIFLDSLSQNDPYVADMTEVDSVSMLCPLRRSDVPLHGFHRSKLVVV